MAIRGFSTIARTRVAQYTERIPATFLYLMDGVGVFAVLGSTEDWGLLADVVETFFVRPDSVTGTATRFLDSGDGIFAILNG